jgi:glycosyltransferase involved in cell wall biosynthesis
VPEFRERALNILYVGTLPPQPDGSGMVAADLLPGFARAGHRVRAVAPITAEARSAGPSFAMRHPEIATTLYEVPLFETSPLDTPPSEAQRQLEGEKIVRIFGACVAAERPDIVVIGRESFAPHVSRLVRVHSLPAVLVFHGTMTFAILNGALPPAIARALVDEFRRVARTVVVAKHLIGPLEGLGIRNITAIPNPVDLLAFTPRAKNRALLRELAIPEAGIVVMHASNLKRLKRPLDVVDAAQRVLTHAADVTFLIVGDGPCRSELETACDEGGLRDRFRFTGWVDHDRMPDWLNLSDVVVMPSEAEAQSLVYLEAQACGRLLLASDIPGAREVTTDGITGLLFKMGVVADLAEKMLLAIGNPALRCRIGENARRSVGSHDTRLIVPRYEAVFRAAIRGDPSTAS